MAAMLNFQEFKEWEDRDDNLQIGNHLQLLMDEKNFSLEKLAEASCLDPKELKNILLQIPGNIRRDSLIAISLALSLSMEETQSLLTSAGLPALYAKNRRDAACIFALMKGIEVPELNQLLYGLEEAVL